MKVKSIGRNVTELHLNNGSLVLISYETPVAAIGQDYKPIKTSKFWSVTTSRHINQFFNRHFVYDQKKIQEETQEYFDTLLKFLKF